MQFLNHEKGHKPMSHDYYVVFETKVGPSEGAKFRTAYNDAAQAKELYQGKMQDGSGLAVRDVYNVVAQGCSDKTSLAICHLNKETIAEIQAVDAGRLSNMIIREIGISLRAADHFMSDTAKKATEPTAENDMVKAVIQQIKTAVMTPF